MPTPILIRSGSIQVRAELNDSPTALELISQLPLTCRGNWWGDEIYFSVPVDQPTANDARTEFALGELGYWPPGQAFCIFFGPTPASHAAEPRMANPGNPLGNTLDNPQRYREFRSDEMITIELTEAPSFNN